MKPSLKITAGIMAASMVLGTATIAFAESSVNVETEIHASSTTGGQHGDNHPLKDLRHDLREEHASSTEAHHDRIASSTEARKEHRAEVKLAIKTKLDARRQENVKRIIENRVKKHQEIINAQKKRISRVALIAGKIKAAGKDTSAADLKIADANAKIELAVSDLASINTTASTSVAALNPGDKLAQIKTLFDTVNADIKAVHQDIADAISDLKGLGKVEFHASSTASTSSHE